MQLTAANRREVIEDLLDIKIFSSMNTIIKEKIRQNRENVKVLDLKKESLTDKVSMQQNFIEQLENTGKEKIEEKEEKISQLLAEENDYMITNTKIVEEQDDHNKVLESYTGATEKLRKLGNLKGKISQKVSTITKEHKFFTENTAPTCTQSIDEEFRINKINDAQTKAKELQSGYKELEEAIKGEEERERQFITLSKEITKLNNDISKNNTRIAGCQRQVRDLESEIQRITDQLANRNIEHDKLETFKSDLQKTYDELVTYKDQINYYDFTYGIVEGWWS